MGNSSLLLLYANKIIKYLLRDLFSTSDKNLLKYSEQLDQASWVKTAMTVTAGNGMNRGHATMSETVAFPEISNFPSVFV